jgi:hypothetical protein
MAPETVRWPPPPSGFLLGSNDVVFVALEVELLPCAGSAHEVASMTMENTITMSAVLLREHTGKVR